MLSSSASACICCRNNGNSAVASAAVERIARNRPELSTPAAGDCHEPDPNAQARSFAHWLLLQLDKALPTMPKEIRAGMLGTLFLDAGRTEALEETLAAFPKARRRICMLYHIEGVAASQIALQSDCGPSNISNSLRRCWMAFNSSAAFRRALRKLPTNPTPSRRSNPPSAVVVA